MFFFEKKNQKIFATLVGVWLRRRNQPQAYRRQSFLVLFFKKERLSSLALRNPVAPPIWSFHHPGCFVPHYGRIAALIVLEGGPLP